jgi:RNA polymerase sigma-70 factor (ECF subfamily)
MTTTPVSLLERLRQPGDQDAWARFVDLYAPLMFSWARRWGLHADAAADLVQDVFLTLLETLPRFEYDPQKSFRAWLRTVTRNRWHDRQRGAATRPLPGNEHLLATVPGPGSQAEEEEDQLVLVRRTLELLRNDFQPLTWRAFWEHGVLGRPAAEVAAQLGVSLSAVYNARFRVLGRLRQELDGILD